ncbi:MAG: AarF/ABC1/UbiB kinase family protein [Deltaproteobacteria bacterium]|nr:AarF/ABC1/UbiB kinase family protein [Deltaproteobacteria bacterium]
MVSLVTALRDIQRLREIYVVLVRHGFGELAQRLGLRQRIREGGEAAALGPAADEVPPSLAPAAERERGDKERGQIALPQRLRLVLMDLGPSFVKLGQIASTRPDLLPKEWIEELKKLQDEVTPVSFAEIEAVLEESLGAPLADLFESIAPEPLAAASIAQVHRAVLKHAEGPKQVVLKVQRPGIAQTVARDVELLHALARLVERSIPESHIYSPCALAQEFDRAISAEMDFTQEADNAARFARNFAGHPQAHFPRVYREATTRRVLTMEHLDGWKVYEAIARHGYQGPAIAKAAVGILIKMIFEDGFFHADPHPGNIVLSGSPEQPRIGLIDLGMVGRFSPELRDKVIDMMLAAMRQDYEALADALYAVGTPTERLDMRAFRAEVRRLADKYLGRPLKEIDFAALIGDLVKGATQFGLEIPPDFTLVGKALMTIEGVGKEIDPELDVLGEARPHFARLLRQRYSPERVAADLWRAAERLAGAAYDLPQQAREVLDELRTGRLTLRTEDPSAGRISDRLGRRLFAGLVVGSLLLSGAWLFTHEPSRALGAGALGAAVLCALWHVVADRRRG